ncbi:hypothetical protein M8J76_000163 [Diaphorina citri]|nr:hypothetical protein M8J76_000163 [Diaphorina citri]
MSSRSKKVDKAMYEEDQETKTMSDREMMVYMYKRLKTLDEFENKMEKMMKSLNEHKQRIETLEVELVQKTEENEMLKQTVEDLTSTVDELSQRSRSQNILISGIPQERKEDVYKIIEYVGNQMDITDPMADVQLAHRMGSSQTAPFVVRLLNTRTRAKWIKAFKGKKLWQKKIYVNEHLTKKNQELFKRTKEMAKEANFKFVWLSDNRILMRKNEQSQVSVIKNMNDLVKALNGRKTSGGAAGHGAGRGGGDDAGSSRAQ